MKGGDMSGNLPVEDTATEESNTDHNDGSETLVEREMPDEASSVQLIKNPLIKTDTQKNEREKTKTTMLLQNRLK